MDKNSVERKYYVDVKQCIHHRDLPCKNHQKAQENKSNSMTHCQPE
ncbi:hypothetical protein BN129_91 [Cronobacter sakazakii 701]|nr:hypothetical protein BN129_91 [Cronobacter sakazakii 701]